MEAYAYRAKFMPPDTAIGVFLSSPGRESCDLIRSDTGTCMELLVLAGCRFLLHRAYGSAAHMG